MSEHQSGGNPPEARTVYVVIGGLLIVVGLGLLAGIPMFGWSWGVLPEFIRDVRRIGWPLAVILLGVLVIIYSRRPGARLPSKGSRVTRSRDKKMVSGVFGGLSDYFSVDPTLLRVGYLAFAFLFDAWGPLVIAYIAASVIVPQEPKVPSSNTPAPPYGG